MKYAIKVLETEIARLKNDIVSRQIDRDPEFNGELNIDNVFKLSNYSDGFIECCRKRISEIERALEVLKSC